MKETERIKNLCETALFIAIVFLGVFIIKFPGPFGYMHIGDSMIFLSVLMLGGKRGAVAGSRGYCQRIHDLGGSYPDLQGSHGSRDGCYDQAPCIRIKWPGALDHIGSGRRSDAGRRLRDLLVLPVR